MGNEAREARRQLLTPPLRQIPTAQLSEGLTNQREPLGCACIVRDFDKLNRDDIQNAHEFNRFFSYYCTYFRIIQPQHRQEPRMSKRWLSYAKALWLATSHTIGDFPRKTARTAAYPDFTGVAIVDHVPTPESQKRRCKISL